MMMQRVRWLAIAVFGLLFASVSVQAEDAESVIKARLAASVPGLEILSVRPVPEAGLYEVETNNRDMLYTTADGRFIIVGDMLELTAEGVSNVTEAGRSGRRAEVLNAIPEAQLVSFAPEGEVKRTLHVFTDIDCVYCRRLHDDVPRLNELGIKVSYYAFPRSGPGTPSFNKYVSVWCADDPQGAMTRAKAGRSVPDASCDNPVQSQFELGRALGVSGTPAIILEDGHMIRGYLPANDLAKGLGLVD